MKCKWCNSEIEDDAKICPHCKAVIHTSNSTSTKNYIEEYLKIHRDDSYSYGNQNLTNTNSIANALGIIGKITFILGLLTFIIALSNEIFVAAFVSIIVAIISGFMFLGFSEIIQLLQDIKNNME